jgi:DNA replication protein DnaC
MTETVLNTMSALKLHGMQRTYQLMLEKLGHHDMSHDEVINTLVQSEWEYRENKKINRNMRQAKFRYGASIEEIDFTASRGLDKTT